VERPLSDVGVPLRDGSGAGDDAGAETLERVMNVGKYDLDFMRQLGERAGVLQEAATPRGGWLALGWAQQASLARI
jgi:hypothetical protein